MQSPAAGANSSACTPPASAPALLPAIPTGNRIPPIAPKGTAGNANARGCLAPLVFVAFHEIEHAPDGRAIETARADFIDREILLDEGFEDRVERSEEHTSELQSL